MRVVGAAFYPHSNDMKQVYLVKIGVGETIVMVKQW